MFSPDQSRLGKIVKTQKQTNALSPHVRECGETLYEIAERSVAATADLNPKDLGPAPISLRRVLHSFTTAYSLCRERYHQRRQLLEMDHRQLKDIGITREQAEREGRKPLWKG
jgi:uncharacterized protein YjiS (DUF1127 family)